MLGVLLESLVVEPTEGGIGYEKGVSLVGGWLNQPHLKKYAQVKFDHFPKLG